MSYPVRWKIRVPSLQIEAEVTTPLPQQELVLDPCHLLGRTGRRERRRGARAIKGHGYMGTHRLRRAACRPQHQHTSLTPIPRMSARFAE